MAQVLASERPLVRVGIPPGQLVEKRYAVSTVLECFLGIKVLAEEHPHHEYRLRVCGEKGELTIADSFFGDRVSRWLAPESRTWTEPPTFRPRQAGLECGLTAEDVPVLFGKKGTAEWVQIKDSQCFCGVDVFGSAFFMLTRYEELTNDIADRYGRFPAGATYACQAGFLDRPVVNEYAEVLWACMQRLWPGLRRIEKRYQLLVSHDVDLPFSYWGFPPWRVARTLAADLLRRRDTKLFSRRLGGAMAAGERRLELDPHYTFDYLIEIAERLGLREAYYFLCGHTAGHLDGFYDAWDGPIRPLIRKLSTAGHEIGLHPSYNSASKNTIASEFETLKSVCADIGSPQESWGGRHHFLRWSSREGFRQWDDAGLAYDSSLGYVEEHGFRCGTCYDYPTFSLLERRELALLERPLIVMDASVFFDAKSGRSEEEICQGINELSSRCRIFGGNFTLLWHNSCLRSERERDLYCRIVTATAE